MPVLEVKTTEPFAMSPDAAATLLSVNKRTIYRLVAEKKLIARKEGSRTLVDYQSVKKHYESLPMLSGAWIPKCSAPRQEGSTMITDDPVYIAHVWRLAYAVDHMHDDRPFLQQMIADTSPGQAVYHQARWLTPPRGVHRMSACVVRCHRIG